MRLGFLIICALLAAPATRPFEPVASHDLENAYIVTSKVISGAQPEGDAGFKALADLGIKTIISVDGATPDVAGATKYGMRYVHLPIGYDGVSDEDGMAIAKAIDELPGPIYLHCHHGKHRSAAAVAVACVMNGSLKPEQAESVLRTFGTGVNYKGLWTAARDARPVDPKLLDTLNVNYVEVAKIPALADVMVHIDQHWDNLKSIQKNGWKTPTDHPDLDAPHEALQIEEHLREARRLQSVVACPQDFPQMMTDSERAVTALRNALESSPADIATINAAFSRANNSCTACHAAHRD